MIKEIYTIRTLTNLHAGSGDANYGIIDKLVQRDPVDEFPIVNASSLKGALRENKKVEKGNNNRHKDIVNIFGNDPNDNDTSVKGNYYFFEARLLSIPVRSNAMPFFRATSVELIEAFTSHLEDLGLTELADRYNISDQVVAKGKPSILSSLNTPVYLEDWAAEKNLPESVSTKLQPIIGDNIALFEHSDLKDLCRHLPVIARNHLESGISQNLWYEEVVPRETVFYTVLLRPDGNDLLNIDDQTIQIGGNATIGYGFTKFRKIS